MIHFQSGEAIVFTNFEEPKARYWAKLIARFTREFWRMLLDRKKIEATPVVVFHSNDPEHQSGLIINRDFVAVRVDPICLTKLAATSEFEGSEPRERLLRALRVTLAEELYRLWMFYQHGVKRSCPHKGNFSNDPLQVVEYYSEPVGFEALQFVARVTGERMELLEKVRAYRAERGLDS